MVLSLSQFVLFLFSPILLPAKVQEAFGSSGWGSKVEVEHPTTIAQFKGYQKCMSRNPIDIDSIKNEKVSSSPTIEATRVDDSG
jgi:hypothetical protein